MPLDERFNVSPSDLLMQRRTKQIQPTDLKMRAIGAVVREFRERAGHSQERLSGECGFDRTYISRVERGIINPTVNRLWKIAEVLRELSVGMRNGQGGVSSAETPRSISERLPAALPRCHGLP